MSTSAGAARRPYVGVDTAVLAIVIRIHECSDASLQSRHSHCGACSPVDLLHLFNERSTTGAILSCDAGRLGRTRPPGHLLGYAERSPTLALVPEILLLGR